MDSKKNMVVIKGEIKTSEVISCFYDKDKERQNVKFNNGKVYSYAFENVELIKNPQILNPNAYKIYLNKKLLYNINSIYVFKGREDVYWHICFNNGLERDYKQNELEIIESCLNSKQAADIFEYLKQLAAISSLQNEETGDYILKKRFDKITFVGSNVALAKYLNPTSLKKQSQDNYTPIFPFGCNRSQYKAVKDAMENQISIIQGPPGTGKTQTILNIIANILAEGKTVQVVSNNNSAIENIYEKLSSTKYGLGFILTLLGNSANKESFVNSQDGIYPEISSWKLDEDKKILYENVAEDSRKLSRIFKAQEELAALKQDKAQLEIEKKYFEQYVGKKVKVDNIRIRKKISSAKWMELWHKILNVAERRKKLGLLFKLICGIKYGVWGEYLYNQNLSEVVKILQYKFYLLKIDEIDNKIIEIEKSIDADKDGLADRLCDDSMTLLRGILAEKYADKSDRKKFAIEDLRTKPREFLDEYPVILSTTFSARNSLGTDTVYDYVIMDEASQVDIVTGALALSIAKNIIIVGDNNQLPNIVTIDDQKRADMIFERFEINEGYKYTKSVLQSVMEVLPGIPQTMLKEHYRCHPRIINFCNQKFYDGKLVIMTEDKGEKDVLYAIKTNPGNHARDHYSQRQIDVIIKEVIPKLIYETKETGIITPYKNQMAALQKAIPDIEISTVHKFQGREKENIIISTVDDEITDFVDNPYLLNVAVSRAKKRLILVVTGNEQKKDRNIMDLLDYIRYNNFEITNSSTNSIFDYLYKQYSESRKAYLKKHSRVSEFDSENLMFALLQDILADKAYNALGVMEHYPLNLIIKDTCRLNEKERIYANNPLTHVDFMIYNRISKRPILAIEVDGYTYHKENSPQGGRDMMKNHIFEVYEIPLLRCKTNGSGEKEKIIDKLNKIYIGEPKSGCYRDCRKSDQ